MSLPIRTTVEDILDVCRYLAGKPTGSTVKDAKAVLDKKRLDGRKLSALKFWNLIEEIEEGRFKVTEDGRRVVKSHEDQSAVLRAVIKRVPPYNAIIERAAHQREDSMTTTDVAAHWHEHFRGEVADNDKILRDQAVCFFQVASGADLGNMIIGRKGAATRLSFSAEALQAFAGSPSGASPTQPAPDGHGVRPQEEAVSGPDDKGQSQTGTLPPPEESSTQLLAKGIFVAHGKNRKPLEQLKKILEQFKIPYRVVVDEPNLGRPISGKVREVMQSCNCAILIFTADEEFKDKDGNTIWRPSENVVFELGATGYLYDNKIVILKEEGVSFPTNFQDIGYIPFEKDQLEAKAMDVLKELVGFGIVKFST
jgi:predicted nucleotide-binding protein